MKKHSLRFLTLTMIGIFIYSCQNEDDFEKENLTSQTTEQEQIENPDKIIGLGKKLENPFTVSVMKQAYQNLKSKKNNTFSKSSTNDLTIETTDYYVRFLPKSDEEKEILQENDSLTLFDMPLDYELEEGVAGAYHDPSIPEGKITWQYTVVPVHYKFRNIQYEILANLFLQEDENEENTLSSKNSLKKQMSEDLWTELENEALRITGNEDDIIDNSSSSLFAKRRKWKPSGRIEYEDNTTATPRIIPLQGAKIIVKRWFKWKSDITDASGNFEVGSFRSRKVKCAIKWERHEWDIRSGSYGQAWFSFESLSRGRNWNKTIRRSSTPRNWLYASVHRGAIEYFYNHNVYGIRKPYSKTFKGRLHIGAKDKDGRAHYFTFNTIIWSAPVVIYSSSKNGTVHNSRDLFATTIHELAHVSHWEIGYSTGQYVIDALADDPFLPESWAVGVEHVITNRVYPVTVVGARNFPYDLDRQDWTLRRIQSESEGYTPIVIDLIDNVNQSTARINGRIDSNRPNDRVTGYTLGQLEDALPGSFGSWWSWRTRIREMYNNPNEDEPLDYLFRQYR